MRKEDKKMIILSAPSGSGKTTIMREVRKRLPYLEFSISATSREPRHNEHNGVDYQFVTLDKFDQMIAQDEFVEWEEVYEGTKYGTPKSELERIWSKGNVIIFDVDVVGGIRLQEKFRERALTIFIEPPSIEELRNRLRARDTDSKEAIEKRVAKAEREMQYADRYDKRVVNDNFEIAVDDVQRVIREFVGR